MFYQGKKVLVTGGTGFVGFHLVEQLLHQGAQVVVPLHQRAFPKISSGARVEFVQADLFSMDDCLRVTQSVDFVFHAAGGVGAAGVGPIAQMELIRKNLVLTAQVLEASWKNNVKRALIFSSSTVYPAVDHPVREEEIGSGQPHPSYLGYGWMRRYFEMLGKFVAASSPLQVAIVRPTAVYGRYDNFAPGTSHVIPALIARAVKKENPYVVWGSGEEVRDFLHITDLARACLLMVGKYATCDPVNIGCGMAVTVKEIVGSILAAAGHDRAKVVFDASKPATIPFRMADISLAKKVLGFEPTVRLEDGIADTVDWFRKQQANIA